MSKNYWLYCLLLEKNNYYVGITKHLERRIRAHKNGSRNAAKFTKKYHAVDLIYKEELTSSLMSHCMSKESQLTLDVMSLVGCSRVRGGDYTRVEDAQEYEHFIKNLTNNKNQLVFPAEWLTATFTEFTGGQLKTPLKRKAIIELRARRESPNVTAPSSVTI